MLMRDPSRPTGVLVKVRNDEHTVDLGHGPMKSDAEWCTGDGYRVYRTTHRLTGEYEYWTVRPCGRKSVQDYFADARASVNALRRSRPCTARSYTRGEVVACGCPAGNYLTRG